MSPKGQMMSQWEKLIISEAQEIRSNAVGSLKINVIEIVIIVRRTIG
jgi:hypothetical protein